MTHSCDATGLQTDVCFCEACQLLVERITLLRREKAHIATMKDSGGREREPELGALCAELKRLERAL